MYPEVRTFVKVSYNHNKLTMFNWVKCGQNIFWHNHTNIRANGSIKTQKLLSKQYNTKFEIQYKL